MAKFRAAILLVAVCLEVQGSFKWTPDEDNGDWQVAEDAGCRINEADPTERCYAGKDEKPCKEMSTLYIRKSLLENQTLKNKCQTICDAIRDCQAIEYKERNELKKEPESMHRCEIWRQTIKAFQKFDDSGYTCAWYNGTKEEDGDLQTILSIEVKWPWKDWLKNQTDADKLKLANLVKNLPEKVKPIFIEASKNTALKDAVEKYVDFQDVVVEVKSIDLTTTALNLKFDAKKHKPETVLTLYTLWIPKGEQKPDGLLSIHEKILKIFENIPDMPTSDAFSLHRYISTKEFTSDANSLANFVKLIGPKTKTPSRDDPDDTNTSTREPEKESTSGSKDCSNGFVPLFAASLMAVFAW